MQLCVSRGSRAGYGLWCRMQWVCQGRRQRKMLERIQASHESVNERLKDFLFCNVFLCVTRVAHESDYFLFVQETITFRNKCQINSQDVDTILFLDIALRQHNILCCDSAVVGTKLILSLHRFWPRTVHKRCGLFQVEHGQPRLPSNIT